MTWNGHARQKTIVPCPFSLDSHSRAQKMAAIRRLYTVPGVGQTTVACASCIALYSNAIFASQIKATAAVAGVELEEPAYKHYQDNKMPEFPAKFSCGRIPAFEGAEGFNLMEGAAIARYSTYHSRIRDSSEIAGWMEENISIVIPVKIRCRQKVVFLTLPSLSLKMRRRVVLTDNH
ncbi:hypothetical protein EDD17DRAFT_857142 [Pisolithus thermaeus]|nr:hypothetical protein EDD17DRAFT_857142 [Pisolithus thermaeus]